jgi:hypothetical protein
VIHAPDPRAAFDAGFAFEFINLPEPFKGFTVGKTILLFQIYASG